MGRLGSRLPRYPIGTTGVTDVINLEDNERINFGDSKDYYIYFNGASFLIDSGTHSLRIDLGTASRTNIFGGDASGDELRLWANSPNTYPNFRLVGNNAVQLRLSADKAFELREEAASWLQFLRATTIWNSDAPAGAAIDLGWSTKTTTDDIIGLDIDASSNLTMGTNKGATGLKINAKAPNGSGHSRGIDFSPLPVDFPVIKVVADAISTPGTLSGQIAIDIGDTIYYIPYYTHGS